MPRQEPCRNHIELLRGTLDILIPRTLQRGPQHGQGISLVIRANSGELLKVETGSLYPALHRLELPVELQLFGAAAGLSASILYLLVSLVQLLLSPL